MRVTDDDDDVVAAAADDDDDTHIYKQNLNTTFYIDLPMADTDQLVIATRKYFRSISHIDQYMLIR